MVFCVKDVVIVFKYVQVNGVVEYKIEIGFMELSILVVIGIGDSLFYFVDCYGDCSIYDVDFYFYFDSKECFVKV